MQGGKTHLGESKTDRPAEAPQAAAHAHFSVMAATDAFLPVLIAAPHAGRAYPADLLVQMRDPEVAAIRLEDRLVDHLAMAVARRCGAGLLVAHAPRALIDLNRHPDDIDWTMVAGGMPQGAVRPVRGGRAASGLGLVPRRLVSYGELWKRPMTRAELDWRRAYIHAPYHEALAANLARLYAQCGAALLIDLHSMPPLGPKVGDRAAPDFVIGDLLGQSCDWRVAALGLEHFAQEGWRAAHNRPYAGGYVLERHGRPARGVHAVQIEVCRATYLDETLREVGPGLERVAEVLSAFILRLAQYVLPSASLPQAAE